MLVIATGFIPLSPLGHDDGLDNSSRDKACQWLGRNVVQSSGKTKSRKA